MTQLTWTSPYLTRKAEEEGKRHALLLEGQWLESIRLIEGLVGPGQADAGDLHHRVWALALTNGVEVQGYSTARGRIESFSGSAIFELEVRGCSATGGVRRRLSVSLEASGTPSWGGPYTAGSGDIVFRVKGIKEI